MAHDTATSNAHIGDALRHWTAVLGAPVAWLVYLQVNYALVPSACRGLSLWVLGLVNFVFLALAAGAGLLGRHLWRQAGGSMPKGSEGGTVSRERFMAALGVVTSVLFFAVILAQGLPLLFFSPCTR